MMNKGDTLQFSYSLLSTWESCREKFYRSYITREKPDHNKMRYLEGTVLQNLWEDFINKKHYLTTNQEWMYANCGDYVDSLLNSNSGRYAFRKGENRRLTIKHIKKFLDNSYYLFESKGFLSKDIKIKSEIEFRFPISERSRMLGKVDFIIKKDGVFHIIDLKKTYNKMYVKPLQLVFYAALFYEKFGIIPETAFFCAKEKKIVNVPVTLDQIKELREYCLDIEKEVFSTNIRRKTSNRDQCWGCIHKGACRTSNAADALIRGETIKIGRI